MKKKGKRQLGLWIIGVLLIGMLSTGNTVVGKTAGTSGSATEGRTTRSDYGLSNPTTNSSGITTWDCVYFGNYWQEDTNGDGVADQNDAKQPVKWRVLSVSGNDAFLLADRNLDCQEYNDTYTSVTWETCTMRSWLNSYGAEENKEGKDYSGNGFINHAFTSAERSAIRTTNVVNHDNATYNTEGGNDTADQVYLLSIDEVTNPAYGFSSDPDEYVESRRAKNTEYAKMQGAWASSELKYAGNGNWWLRSPGYYSSFASYVYYNGDVDRIGYSIDIDRIITAARPVLHLNLLSASSWSYAGIVTSEGGEIGMATPTPAPSIQPTLSWDIPTKEPTPPTSDSNSDSMALFENCEGSTTSKGISDYLISDWSFKSPTFPLTLEKEQYDDGGYKIKATIGIGRKDILEEESTWNQYKSSIKKLREKKAKTSELTNFIKTFGGKSGTFSVTEKMKAKPSIAFAGYYEIICDKNNNIVSQEGGGTAAVSWSAKKSWQSVVMAGPIPIPLYFDLTGKIDLESELGISFASLDEKQITGSLKLKPSLALGGGLGVSGVVSVGVEGRFSLDAQLVPASKGSYNASLALKAYIAFVLDWTYQLPGAEKKGVLWDTTGRRRLSFLGPETEMVGEGPSLSLVDRSYGEKTTEWYGNGKPQKKLRSSRVLEANSSVSVSSLQEYVMPNTIPLVRTVGKKTVMVFQSNDSGRNTADSSCLMYSVCESGTWSQPEPVWDTGTCDLFADMKVINGTLYLVWQKEKTKISEGADASDILDDMEINSEICMAVFDTEAGAFQHMQYITDDSETDMMPVLAESSSEVSVVWIQNTAGSFFCESGKNRVMSVTRQGDTLTAPVQLDVTEDYVNELAAAYVGGELQTAIVTTQVNYLESDAAAGIPAVSVSTGKGKKILSSATEYAGGIQFLDEKLHYLEDTYIYEYDTETEEVIRISPGPVLSRETADGGSSVSALAETTVFGSSYRVCKQDGKTVIIWNEATEMGSILKSSVKTEDGFSSPVTLFETEKGETIQNFDVILMADGNWQFAVNTWVGDEEKSSIKYITKQSLPKLMVDYILAEEAERKNGTQPIYVSVTNDSMETVMGYTVRIYTDTKTYVEKKVKCKILPGETYTFAEKVNLAGLDGQTNLNVQVWADGQRETDETITSAVVGMTDLSLDLEKQIAFDKESVIFSAVVTNKSEVATTAQVDLYEKETGTLIQSLEAGALMPGTQRRMDFILRVDDMAIIDTDVKCLKVVVVSEKEEYNKENNIGYGTVYADEVKQVAPSASPDVIPGAVVSPAPTFPLQTIAPIS